MTYTTQSLRGSIMNHYRDPFLNNQDFMESELLFFFRGSLDSCFPPTGSLKGGSLCCDAEVRVKALMNNYKGLNGWGFNHQKAFQVPKMEESSPT